MTDQQKIRLFLICIGDYFLIHVIFSRLSVFGKLVLEFHNTMQKNESGFSSKLED